MIDKPVYLDWIYNIIGIIGVISVLSAYFMLQSSIMVAHDITYLTMNILGSLCILLSLIRFWNLPSAIIQTVWVGISIYGFLQIGQD